MPQLQKSIVNRAPAALGRRPILWWALFGSFAGASLAIPKGSTFEDRVYVSPSPAQMGAPRE